MNKDSSRSHSIFTIYIENMEENSVSHYRSLLYRMGPENLKLEQENFI